MYRRGEGGVTDLGISLKNVFVSPSCTVTQWGIVVKHDSRCGDYRSALCKVIFPGPSFLLIVFFLTFCSSLLPWISFLFNVHPSPVPSKAIIARITAPPSPILACCIYHHHSNDHPFVVLLLNKLFIFIFTTPIFITWAARLVNGHINPPWHLWRKTKPCCLLMRMAKVLITLHL